MNSRSPVFVSAVAALAGSRAARAEAPADGWVVFQSSRAEAYRPRADGTEVTRLPHEGACLPQWSRDGRWIPYTDSLDSVFVP